MIWTTLAVIAILSSLGLLRPLLGWITIFISSTLDFFESLSSSSSGKGKRGAE